MQSTRSRIVDYLTKYKSASAVELGRALNFTTANIRHHLKILEDQGQITLLGQRDSPSPGRPADVYQLSPHTLGDNTACLLTAILESWKEAADHPDRTRADLGRIAAILGDPDEERADSPVERLNRAVRRMNDLQYQASWEAHPTGPRVLLRHCPYLDLADDYPQLCALDEELLTVLVDQPLTLVEKRSPLPRGRGQCIFKAQPKES